MPTVAVTWPSRQSASAAARTRRHYRHIVIAANEPRVERAALDVRSAVAVPADAAMAKIRSRSWLRIQLARLLVEPFSGELQLIRVEMLGRDESIPADCRCQS